MFVRVAMRRGKVVGIALAAIFRFTPIAFWAVA